MHSINANVRLYVCLSGLGGNVILSALIFCVHIPLVYEHLFYKYHVRRSVGQATKGKRASLLMDVVILVYFVKTCNKQLKWKIKCP